MPNHTLLQKLRDDASWEGFDAVSQLRPADAVETVRRWLARAAETHDDKNALRLYDLLLLAVDDAHEGEERRKTERTLIAIDIYRGLPEFRKSRECVDRETYEMADVRNQTLDGLKKRILADVALRWSTTKDDDEVPRLAGFLIEVAKKRDRHALDRLTEALKEATKSVWKKERALLLMARFLAETDADGERSPFRTLLIGVMRSLSARDALPLSMILVQLPFDAKSGGWNELGGDAVMAALERDAEEYRHLHVVMTELRKALKIDRGNIRGFAPSYPRPGQVELTIVASPSYSSRGHEENDFHDLASALRDQARDWLKARQATHQDAPAVKLAVQWPLGEYATRDAPPRFQRLFELHTPKS